VPCEAEGDTALEGRSTESDLERSHWARVWRKRGSSDVVVGGVGGFVNIGKAGVGGWTSLSVSVVAGDVGLQLARGPGSCGG
jgi:hypothetical protein